MTTSMRSASIIIRRSPTGATARTMPISRRRAASTTWITCAGGSAAARPSTGTMPMRPSAPRRRARPITDGAYGKPWVFRAEGSRLLVVEPAYGARRRRRDRRHRMAAAIEADLAHRDRHSGRRQGAERTQRLSRSEILGIRLSAVLARRARRSRAGARARGDPVAFRSGAARLCDRATIRSRRPTAGAWWTRPTSSSGPGMRGLFPPFPISTSVWADGANWETGHWITGRIEGATLDRLIAAHPAAISALPIPARIPVDGFVDGYVIDRPMSVRGALEPLMRLFGVDAVASRRHDRVAGRGGRAVICTRRRTISSWATRSRRLKLTRAQETELPQQVEIGFTEGDTDYRRATVASRRLSGSSRREARADAPSSRAAPRRSASPMPGCRICGRGAKAPSSSCRPAASSSSRAT